MLFTKVIYPECGGKDACGKCHVIVPDKNAVTEITEDENKHLSLGETGMGYSLACHTACELDESKKWRYLPK